jgi:hypothetical protein
MSWDENWSMPLTIGEITHLEDAGYYILFSLNPEHDLKVSGESWEMDTLDKILDDGNGLTFIYTHANPGQSVMFEDFPAAATATEMNARKAEVVSQLGVSPSDVEVLPYNTVSHGVRFGLFLRDDAFASMYIGNRSLVWIAASNAGDISLLDAEILISYDWATGYPNNLIHDEAMAQFVRMITGDTQTPSADPRLVRSFRQAYLFLMEDVGFGFPLYFEKPELYGDATWNGVLNPAVSSFFTDSFASGYGSVVWEFDAEMYTGVPFYLAASSSDVTIYGGGWSDSYTLFLYLSDVGHGDACVTLDPWYLRSANNVFANLDGNTDPTRYSPPCDTGAIGSAPNLDEHVQDILVDDNPVSKVREFRAGRNVVEWRVDSGRNVKRYVIEGRVAGGNWFFMEEDPYFVGHHSVAIPYPCVIDDVRLVEEEIGGKRILYYWDRLTSSVEGGAGTPRSEIHECAPPPMAPRESMMTMPETQRSAALSIVIVTSGTADVEVGNWMAVVDSMVVDYWEDIGHSISVLDVDTLAVGYSERRAAIKDDLEVRFLAGQLDAVHVIGDANDYVEFVGDQVSSFWDPELGWEGQRQALLASRYAGQATKDVVGTWAIADNYSGPFVNTAGDYPYILTGSVLIAV